MRLASNVPTWDTLFLAISVPVAVMVAWPVLGTLALAITVFRIAWWLFTW